MVWSAGGDHLFAGSHGGDVYVIQDIEDASSEDASCVARGITLRQGLGKGGSICDMKLTQDESHLVLCSHDCTLSYFDLDSQWELELHNTGDYDHWYTSVAISNALNCILAADNRGYVKAFDPRLPCHLHHYSLHKSHKISCIDVHSSGYVIATCSNDRTCRVFDLRRLNSEYIQNYREEVAVYLHEGVVSSGYFSPLVPYRLLTTSQSDEIRVYDTSVAGELLPPKYVIPHSHKFYQHITTIKASWHPLMRDVFAVGRYDRPRGFDLISLSKTGSNPVTVKNIGSREVETILCVNSFSPDGRYLASATANNIVLWASESRSVGSDLPTNVDERVSMAIAAQASCLESFSPDDSASARRKSSRRSPGESSAPEYLDFSAFAFKRPG